jgi:hypothetical protein
MTNTSNPHIQTLTAAVKRLMHGHPPPEPGSQAWDQINTAIRGLHLDKGGGGAASYTDFGMACVEALYSRMTTRTPPRPF